MKINPKMLDSSIEWSRKRPVMPRVLKGKDTVQYSSHLILLLAKYTGFFALSRLLTAEKIRILAWHGVWLGESHFGNFLYMSKNKFARRLQLLEKWGYPVMPLSHILEGREAGNLPGLSTAITIDDGWWGTYRFMLPELERHNFPATVYLTTYYCVHQAPVIDVAMTYCFSVVDAGQRPQLHIPSFNYGPVPISTAEQRQQALGSAIALAQSLDGDAERQMFLHALCDEMCVDYGKMMDERWFHLMSPLEVKDAAERGFCFELHTHRHRTRHAGKDCLEPEIAVNRSIIEMLTGNTAAHFCYPSGVFSAENWSVLRRINISSATTTRVGLVDCQSSNYALPRILDGEQVSELEFEAEMSGFIELTRNLRKSLSEIFKPNRAGNPQ